MSRIIRVFPRRTNLTPTDSLAFVGDPPLWRPDADEVRVSVTFTWDLPEGYRLVEAWRQHYPHVSIGGPALGTKPEGFTAGLYLRESVTFTSRGCNRSCQWCLVPLREGKLTLIPHFEAGHIIQDNDFLACPSRHRHNVYEMLSRQPRAAVFSGGLRAASVTRSVADELRQIRIDSVFLAADTAGAIKPLAQACERLHFLRRRQRRCYVLVGYGGESIGQAEARLEAVWAAGAMPFAMLYQPPDRWIRYSREWRALQREWTRPAAMFASHHQERESA